MDRAEEIAESWSMQMRKGYIKLAVLMFLNKKALSGYDVMKEFEEETLGFWTLKAGGVYPVLKELEEKAYIKGQWKSNGKRRKKIYEITDEGKRIAEIALLKQQQMSETIGGLFRQFALEVLGTNLPPTPSTFHFPPFGKSLREKPVDEQIRILKDLRTRMHKSIKLIDERLGKLEESK
jgi:PadR family transcriptional regulator PadR